MDKKILDHTEGVVAAVPSTQPTTPVTKMLLECTPAQTNGNASINEIVTTAHVNLDAKNQQVRQVATGTEDQDIIVLSQLKGYLQKGSRSIAGLFLPTSGGMMVGNIDMGTASEHTIIGLPSSWGEAGYIGNDYAASVGIVKDILGDYEARLNDLIDKITKYSGEGEGSMKQLLKDLGSPKENQSSGGQNGSSGEQSSTVTFEHPDEAKWLLLSAKNAMTGTLRFESKQGALLTDPEPTIKNLKTGDLKTIGTATKKEDLQKIVAVSDLTKILDNLKKNSSSGDSQEPESESGSTTPATFPEWTGQEVPYLVAQTSNGSSEGSTQNPIKSTNSENYMKKDNGTYTLLRRGLYLVTFVYEFSNTQSREVTCTGTLTAKEGTTTDTTENSEPQTTDTNEPKTVFTIKGSSDGLTLSGSSYILVPGDKATSEYNLELKLTTSETEETTTTASKSYVVISYMGAGY